MVDKIFYLDAGGDNSNNIHIIMIAMSTPIRQGSTSYPYLVLQFPSTEVITLKLAMEEAKLQEYKDFITQSMEGPTHDIFGRVLKALTKKRLNTPSQNFRSHRQMRYIKCSLKASDGTLHPTLSPSPHNFVRVCMCVCV